MACTSAVVSTSAPVMGVLARAVLTAASSVALVEPLDKVRPVTPAAV